MEKSRENSRHGKAGNFCCTHCKYVAKYQSELRRHMRLHWGVKPFVCVFCPYRSAWKGDLKRHMESHHRERFSSETELSKIMSQFKNNAGTNVTSLNQTDIENQVLELNDNKHHLSPRSSNTTTSDELTSSLENSTTGNTNVSIKCTDRNHLNSNLSNETQTNVTFNTGFVQKDQSRKNCNVDDKCSVPINYSTTTFDVSFKILLT